MADQDSSTPESVPDSPQQIVLSLDTAVGIVGSGSFKAEWVAPLESLAVHLVLDNDESGQKGGRRIRELCHAEDVPVRFVELPEGINDVNDFFLERSKEDFEQLVRASRKEAPHFPDVVYDLLQRVSDRTDRFCHAHLARRIYHWFERNGGVFMVDGRDRILLMFESQLYKVGNDPDFESLILDKTDVAPLQRLFVGAWILTLFFLPSIPPRAILKMSGAPGSGKTAAARAFSCLV